jgi:predicted acylesterase/phospholipase RssA
VKRILAIDGGGIRGVIPARVLVELEAKAGKPLHQMFDLVAGTSTGGILACGIAAGVPAAALLDLYARRGAEIFSRSAEWIARTADGVAGPKYDAAPLEAILSEVLGDKRLSDALTHLLVPAFALELPGGAGSPRVPGAYVFKTSAVPALVAANAWAFNTGNIPVPVRTLQDAYLRDVARATSAAETYFAPHNFTNLVGENGTFADGGTFADSPGMCALAEAAVLWPEGPLYLLALGTGQSVDALPYAKYRDAGLVDWARAISHVFMDGQQDAIDYQLRAIMRGAYRRLDVSLGAASSSMDDASAGNIAALLKCGDAIAASGEFLNTCAALFSLEPPKEQARMAQPTQPVVSRKAGKHGRLPARRDERTLLFANYLQPALPPPALAIDNFLRMAAEAGLPDTDAAAASMLPMDGNDTLGDCTIAALAHAITLFRGIAGLGGAVMSAADVTALYFKLTGGQDTGLVELDVLNYWKANAVDQDQISAYVSIDPKNHDHVKLAMQMFGGVYLGFQVQANAIQDFESGTTWTPGDLTNDGHAVLAGAYDAGTVTVATWGGLQKGTWAWWDECVDEAYAVLPPEAMQPGFAPGFDSAQLKADLPALK